jgi:hypothetical protein
MRVDFSMATVVAMVLPAKVCARNRTTPTAKAAACSHTSIRWSRAGPRALDAEPATPAVSDVSQAWACEVGRRAGGAWRESKGHDPHCVWEWPRL